MDEKEALKNINDNVEKIKENGYTLESGLTNISLNVTHIDNALSRTGNIYDILEKINRSTENVDSSIKKKRFTGTRSTSRGATSKNDLVQVNNTLGVISGYSKNIEENTRLIQNDVRLILNAVNSISGLTGPNNSSSATSAASGNTGTANNQETEDEKRRRIKKELFSLLRSTTTKFGEGKISSGSTISGVSSLLSNISGTTNFAKFAGVAGIAASIALEVGKMIFDVYARQDRAASDYAREIGGGKRGKREAIIRTDDFIKQYLTPSNGYTQDLIFSAMTEYSAAIGRSAMGLTNEGLKSVVDLKRFKIGADILSNFETLGKGIQETDGYFTTLYQRVSKRGLSFRNVSDAVNKNLKMAQTHNFSSGLRSLERMAERSTQLKFNMQEAANFADKVSTFEGAIGTGAALSVLGGSFTQHANPMQLLYEGLNSVDEIQERMIKMVGDMAEYNKETQSFRISAFNQQRIKAAASAMGVSREEMTNIAFNQARYRKIEEQLRSNGNLNLNGEIVEYIKNLAEFTNGRAKIRFNGEDRDVSTLTNKDITWLKAQAEKKAQKDAAGMGDIFEQTMGIGDKLDNIFTYLSTKLGSWVAKIANVGWEDKSEKRYWWANSDNRRALRDKYGSRRAAKRALKQGLEDDLVDEYFGVEGIEGSGAVNREMYNATWTSRKNNISTGHKARFFSGKRLYENLTSREGYKNSEAYYNTRRNKGIERASGIISGPSHINGGIPALYNGELINIEGGEALINKHAVNAYGRNFFDKINTLNVSNVKNVTPIKNVAENNLKPLTVAPVVSGSNPNVPQKISINDFKINLGGKIELTSNGSTRDFDLNKLSEPQLDKLTQLIYKKVYDEIRFMTMKGYSKETSMLRGS